MNIDCKDSLNLKAANNVNITAGGTFQVKAAAPITLQGPEVQLNPTEEISPNQPIIDNIENSYDGNGITTY